MKLPILLITLILTACGKDPSFTMMESSLADENAGGIEVDNLDASTDSSSKASDATASADQGGGSTAGTSGTLEGAESSGGTSSGSGSQDANKDKSDSKGGKIPWTDINTKPENGILKNEVVSCAVDAGVSPDKVVVVKKLSVVEIKSDEILFIKITGNQRQVKLNVNGDAKGVCVFVAGNQNKFSLNLKNAVMQVLSYKGRGNQSNGSLSFEASSLKVLNLNLSGNKPVFEVTGGNSCGDIGEIKSTGKVAATCK